jgi:hypothetical protein
MSTSVVILLLFLDKEKMQFSKTSGSAGGKQNQGSFQGIFYCIAFRKTVRKYFPSRSLPLKKRNAITEKFTTNSVERPF